MTVPPGDQPDRHDQEPILITPDMLVRPARPSGRVDFERGMSYAPPATVLLIVANIAAFVWEVNRGALASRESIIAAGALSRTLVLNGEPWRLVTPMFLHGSPDHLIGNMIALYVLGLACEHAVGSARMLGVYLSSGIAAALLSMAMSPGPSVGASGAIFGLMGAVIAVLNRHQQRFYLRDKRIAAVLAAWAIYTIVTGLMSPFVDNAAHAGGFLGGALLGLRLEPRLGASPLGRPGPRG